MTRNRASLKRSTLQVTCPLSRVDMMVIAEPVTFAVRCLITGVAANAKVGSELIKVTAIDNDIGNNSLVEYHIVTMRYFQSQNNGSEDVGSFFIIGELPCIQYSYYTDWRHHSVPALYLGYVTLRSSNRNSSQSSI